LAENDQGGVSLVTFLWFTENLCDKPQFREVNRYDKNTSSWQTEIFRTEKYENFHNCSLLFNFGTNNLSAKAETKEIQKSIHVNYIKKLTETIAEKANFTVLEQRVVGEISFNETQRTEPVILNCLNQDPELYLSMFFMSFYLAAPLGEEYNCYEKLLLPFDSYVWAFLLLTFGLAFITIFALKFTSVSVRKFVVGSRVNDPLENLTRIFFGVSQTVLPGRNFSRFLTMLFILFCLIFRTVWQAKIFEFMQKDMRKPRVQTYKEMVAKNFTIYQKPSAIFDFEDIKKGIDTRDM
jgi:hypothetical protein